MGLQPRMDSCRERGGRLHFNECGHEAPSYLLYLSCSEVFVYQPESQTALTLLNWKGSLGNSMHHQMPGSNRITNP
jgi:hypothetical protein